MLNLKNMVPIQRKDVLLSVCMVTFNHEKWIDKAIEGVMSQITDFHFELVIGEDSSTDGTRDIVKRYWTKYPDIIKPFFNETNLGLSLNFSQLLNKCKGRYIAICEGDDFWTDPFKLQRQADFLENNPDCIICSHNFSKLDESSNNINTNGKYYQDFYYDQEKYLKDWMTQPVTCMFRNIFCDYTFFNKEYDMFCDVILFYELLKHGSGYFMKENMSTFRVHRKALSSGLTHWQWHREHVKMFDYLYKYNKRDKLLLKLSGKYCLILYKYKLLNQQDARQEFYPLKEYLRRTPNISEIILVVIVKVPYYFVKYRIFRRIRSGFINER